MKRLAETILTCIIILYIITCLLLAIDLNNICKNYNDIIVQQQEELRDSDTEIKDLKRIIRQLDEANYSDLSVSELFRIAANEYDLDYKMLYAIAIHESGNFTSTLWLTKNNPGGMKCGDGWCAYDSQLEGILAMAKNLKCNYINLGLDTLERIQPKYCPNSYEWVVKVQDIMNEIN